MANHGEINPMLTTSDVARLLNVHINTIRRWSNQGIIKTYRIGSRGDRRFHREDVANFLLQKTKMVELDTGMESPSSLDQPREDSDNLLTARNI